MVINVKLDSTFSALFFNNGTFLLTQKLQKIKQKSKIKILRRLDISEVLCVGLFRLSHHDI